MLKKLENGLYEQDHEGMTYEFEPTEIAQAIVELLGNLGLSTEINELVREYNELKVKLADYEEIKAKEEQHEKEAKAYGELMAKSVEKHTKDEEKIQQLEITIGNLKDQLRIKARQQAQVKTGEIDSLKAQVKALKEKSAKSESFQKNRIHELTACLDNACFNLEKFRKELIDINNLLININNLFFVLCVFLKHDMVFQQEEYVLNKYYNIYLKQVPIDDYGAYIPYFESKGVTLDTTYKFYFKVGSPEIGWDCYFIDIEGDIHRLVIPHADQLLGLYSQMKMLYQNNTVIDREEFVKNNAFVDKIGEIGGKLTQIKEKCEKLQLKIKNDSSSNLKNVQFVR